MRNPEIPRAPQGNGSCGLTTVPSGAITLIGRVNPWLLGMSSAITHLIAVYAAAFVKGSGELMPPFTAAELPVQSTIVSSP